MTGLLVLISVPHGGLKIPRELRSRVALSKRDIFHDGDAYTREIYHFQGAVRGYVDSMIARAFVDLNRAPTDRPPTNSDGVIKTVTTMGVSIHRL
jgi:formiminoglutamase